MTLKQKALESNNSRNFGHVDGRARAISKQEQGRRRNSFGVNYICNKQGNRNNIEANEIIVTPYLTF
jgi:hypothetical protein